MTERCIELVKSFEGFFPHIYLCPAGVPTIVTDMSFTLQKPKSSRTALLKKRQKEFSSETSSMLKVRLFLS